MTFSASERRTLWVVTACAAVIRIVFFLLSTNSGGDAAARTFVAVEWARDPVVVTPGHWMPLQIYLSGMALWVWDNLWLAPRVVSLICGIASLWPFARLVRSFFSWNVTLAATWLFTLYGLHIAYSGVSSSEAPFFFFALWAMAHYAEWWKSQDLRSLVWSGLFWLPATWTRNEAWWLAAGSGLLLVGRLAWEIRSGRLAFAQALKPVIIFGVLVSLGPVLWFVVCAIEKGDPLYTYTRVHNSYVYSLEHGAKPRPLWYRLAFWPLGLTLSLGPHIVLLSLAGLLTALRKHIGWVLLAFMLAYGLPFWSMQALGGGGVNVRHTMLIGMLLLAFAPFTLEQFAPRLTGKLSYLCAAGAGLWLLVIFGLGETRRGELSQKFSSISPRLHDRWHVMDVTAWLRTQLQPTDRIALDEYNDESSSLQFYVHLVPEHVRIYWKPTQPLSVALDPLPRFLVCAYEGPLGQALQLDFQAMSQERNGLLLTRRYTNDVYAVFEVAPRS